MTLKPRHFAGFHDGLRISYEEEISGAAYFTALAAQHEGRAREALLLLARMEQVTAAAICPLVQRYDLAPIDAADLMAAGRDEAGKKHGASWTRLVAEMAADFPAYVAEFEAIRECAPVEAAGCLDVLIDHEVAAVEFARLEVQLDPGSLAPLRAFLSAHGGQHGHGEASAVTLELDHASHKARAR